jgi:hypothetical protein
MRLFVIFPQMKTLLTIALAFLAVFCSGQTKDEALYELTIPYKPATINILTDTGVLFTSKININLVGSTYKGIPAGHYKIQISGQGQPTIVIDSIIVKEGQALRLAFTYNGPCLYEHPPGYIPTCPKNHRDSIITIGYGLVATSVKKVDNINKSSKEDADTDSRWGGCVTTGCDPKYYCKKHDIEF